MQPQIEAIFESKFVTPGQKINCMIYLNIPQYFSYGRLICKIQGKEKSGIFIKETKSYINKEGTWVTEDIILRLKDKKDIFENELIFLEGPVAPGSYQYPFIFTLPYNVPSSFEYEVDNDNYAKIKYQTKVKFEGTSDGKHFEATDEDKLHVLQVYPSIFRHNFDEKIIPLKTCFCFSRGEVMIKAQFDKTIYHPGETASFLMSADAGVSEVSPEDIIGDCFMKVIVKCKNRQKVFIKNVDSISLGKLEKGFESGVMTMNPKINVPIEEMTTLGRLIESQFFLRARAVMGMCCQDDPTIALKVLVCGLPPPQLRPNFLKQFHAPPGWQQPQLVPPFQMNLATHANMYPNYYQESAKIGAQENLGSINPMLMNAPNEVPIVQKNEELELEEKKGNGGVKANALMGILSLKAKNKPVHPMEIYEENYAHAPGEDGVKEGEDGPMGNPTLAEHVLLEEKEKENKRMLRLAEKMKLKIKKKNNGMVEPNQPVIPENQGENEGVVQPPIIEEKPPNGQEAKKIEVIESDSSYDDSSSDQIRKGKVQQEQGNNPQI